MGSKSFSKAIGLYRAVFGSYLSSLILVSCLLIPLLLVTVPITVSTKKRFIRLDAYNHSGVSWRELSHAPEVYEDEIIAPARDSSSGFSPAPVAVHSGYEKSGLVAP